SESRMAKHHRQAGFEMRNGDLAVVAIRKHFGPSYGADPGRVPESVGSFADSNRVRCAVGDISHSDVAGAKEHSIAVGACIRAAIHPDVRTESNLADWAHRTSIDIANFSRPSWFWQRITRTEQVGWRLSTPSVYRALDRLSIIDRVRERHLFE